MYLFRKIMIAYLLFSLVSANTGAYALSLGDLKVYSYLNEPLSAEIIVDGVDNINVTNIVAELASDKDFERTGIPKSFLLNRLKFEVVRNNNITVIHVSTHKPIKETYVDFLLQVVWPEGKIIKNYTVLLDPAGVDAVKRDTPISKQKKPEKTVSKNNFSSAIFATSLEDSMEHEISLEQKKQIAKMADEVIANSPPVTQEIDLYEANAIKEDNSTNNNIANTNNNGVLDKVASSLQVFAQQPHRTNVDYEKLLDLKPSPSILNKHEIPIAENLAMAQINSELKELRKRDEQKNFIEHSSPIINPNKADAVNHNLELVKKYGNDLLLAFFLVSATIFLFYKIIPASNKNHEDKKYIKATKTEQTANKDNVSIAVSQDSLQLAVQNIATENNTPTINAAVSPLFSAFAKNEELELKLDLAKQYIEAGDKRSAQDILQDLNNIAIKEPKYKDKLDSLLRCIV